MRQESHRIYWQQWSKQSSASSSSSSSSASPGRSKTRTSTVTASVPVTKRDLITSSAAIRLSDAAKAKDVTSVLRNSMKLPMGGNTGAGDALVLVGTMYGGKEPLHVINSLQPSQNPLTVRDAMNEYLAQNYSSSTANSKQKIAPKLQWFYVPNDPSSNVPAFLELEGNSVGMNFDPDHAEGEEDLDDEDELDLEDLTLEEYATPWRKDGSSEQKETEEERRARKQKSKFARRYQLLSNYQQFPNPFYVSGIIYKQSFQDPFVWSKVNCLLTENYLWYGLRRISLTRALLLEAPQKHRCPLGFQLITEAGVPHYFRVSSKHIQLQWISALSERIVQTHENQIMAQAELIVTEETQARNARMMQLIPPRPSSPSDIFDLLRWSIEVAEYKEDCRHLARRLPSKRSQVVATTGGGSNNNNNSSSSLSLASPSIRQTAQIDSDFRDLARSTHDKATRLLANAMIAKVIPGYESLVDPHCRHIEYVLTGRFRRTLNSSLKDLEGEEASGGVTQESISDLGNRSSGNLDLSEGPPIDLFDSLLEELKDLASPRATV